MKIPTWAWALIAVAIIGVAIYAFRKQLGLVKAKEQPNDADKPADATGSGGTATPATPVAESALSKMRRVA